MNLKNEANDQIFYKFTIQSPGFGIFLYFNVGDGFRDTWIQPSGELAPSNKLYESGIGGDIVEARDGANFK